MSRVTKHTSTAAAAAVLLSLSACQSARQNAQGTIIDEYSAGLAALRSGSVSPEFPEARVSDLLAAEGTTSSLDELVRASQQAFAEILARTETSRDEIVVMDPPETVIASAPVYDEDSAGLGALMSDSSAVMPSITQAPASLSTRDIARQLAQALTNQLFTSTQPLIDALALLGLDGLAPGAIDAALEVHLLSPEERRHLDAARAFLESVRASADGDDDAPADTAQQIALDLSETRPLRIVRAELCSRVDGYGQFATFEPSVFIAGRRNRVIVYVEVDRFRHAEVTPSSNVYGTGAGHYAVELTQRVEIYHKADNVLAMATPVLADRRVSRNRFRDYYVVTAIDLPQTLTVGQYEVKITMRDRADNSLAQAVVPLTIVADASAILADHP